jgi:formylglycine-generating enzyme required for sulfatase activity
VDGTWKDQRYGVGFAITVKNGEHPVTSVSWEDGQAFCAWLSKKEGKTYRLPTDEEWSIAVGLGRAEKRTKVTTPAMLSNQENTEFPWGGDFPPKTKDMAGNYSDESRKAKAPSGDAQYLEDYDDGFPTTAPVMSFKPNKLGLYDLGGNMSEWCEDWYHNAQESRVLRGGSWFDTGRVYLLSSNRVSQTPGKRSALIGFRCVLVVSSLAPAAAATPPPVAPPPARTMEPLNPAAATPALKDGRSNTLGMKFLPVPGTGVHFCIHETRYKDYAAYAAEAPGVAMNWKNQFYGSTITERNEDHPVTQVSWEDAQAFCAWLSKKEGKTYRLPTDEEWSIAVGLGHAEKRTKDTTPAMLSNLENTEFPWGGDYPPKSNDMAGNYGDSAWHEKFPKKPSMENYTDGFATTSPVMSFKPNKLGLYDLGGNVWEWCEDWYDHAQKERVLRSGSWYNYDRGLLLSSRRHHGVTTARDQGYGFRVVLVVSSSPPAAAAIPPPVAPPPARTMEPLNPAAATPALKDGPANTLGMKFLPVPGTDVHFCIHETRYKDYAAYAAEAPGVAMNWKNQAWDGFTITERNEDHPVVGVSWADAQAFCVWLSKKEGKTYRLPTDEEWSIAAGLGQAEKRTKDTTPAMLTNKESTEFPWGGDFPPKSNDMAGNYSDESRKAKAHKDVAKYLEGYDDGYPTTAPVMSFKPNKLGLYDLGGNLWEWCEDWYDHAQQERVLRGGCWTTPERILMLSSVRHHNPPTNRSYGNGFRVVLVGSGG